ncbi:MAG: hypothetical protein QW760_06940, partial [Thermofilaceae archaeon]
MKNWQEVLNLIEKFHIYSSTEVTFTALDALSQIFHESSSFSEAFKNAEEFLKRLFSLRPTSVMTLNVMSSLLSGLENLARNFTSLKDVVDELDTRISFLTKEISSKTSTVAALGARRVREGDKLLTCSYSRTVKAMFSKLKEEGKDVHVYVTESRPGGEGVALAKELGKMSFPVELIVDSAVRFYMKDINIVVVGAEAIAANGAVVNKVGTSLIALAAHEARVRTFVLASTHKFSPETVFGELVRLPVIKDTGLLPGLERYSDLNVAVPLFDVTPPR